MTDEQRAYKAAISGKIWKAQFIWFFIATTLLCFAMGFVWYMSPLGLGFAEWPTDTNAQNIAFSAYWVSYFIGIPLLFIGQVASAAFAVMGRIRVAFRIPVVSIGLFLASAAITLAFIGH